MKRIATNSMVGTFKRCREKYALRYIEGLVKARQVRAPSFGSLFHELIRRLWVDGDNMSYVEAIDKWRADILKDAARQQENLLETYGINDEEIVESAKVQANEIATECLELFLYYRETVWKKERNRYEPIFVETTFEVPLTTRNDRRHPVWRFSGKWDIVLWDRVMEEVVVRDYKTTMRKPESFAAMAEIDTQPIAYIYSSHYLATHPKADPQDKPEWPTSFPPVARFELEIVRKKVPREPPPLKKGGLSKAQNIDTTPELYRQAIKKNGLNEADYADVLEKLEARTNAFYYRHSITVRGDEIRRWADETRWCLEEARTIELHRERAFRADPMTCQNQYGRLCEYHSICYGDAAIARAEFVVKKVHSELDEEEDESFDS